MSKKEPLSPKLLDAVTRVINSKGITHLTLQNVADEAGVSKGGLLHYFPNKRALIESAIASVLEHDNNEIEKILSNDTDTGNLLRAYIEVSQKDPHQMTAGLLGAIATDPELLKPIQKQFDKMQKRIEEEEMDTTLATIIRLAADGLWFCDMFGLAPLKEDIRENVLKELIRLSRSKQKLSDKR